MCRIKNNYFINNNLQHISLKKKILNIKGNLVVPKAVMKALIIPVLKFIFEAVFYFFYTAHYEFKTVDKMYKRLRRNSYDSF